MMGRPRPPLNVLIIEDEAILVMDMEAAIEEAGHRVIADVASFDDLKSLTPKFVPDLAFVDINLAKGSNGLDASRLVRERWAQTCIVFVTANPKKVPVGHAGSHGVIAKPFTRIGLIAALSYLSESICDPPPKFSEPTSFKAFPNRTDMTSE